MEESDSYHTQNESIEPEDNKKPFVVFAKLNKYFIIPFLCPILCMTANYFLALLVEEKVIKRVEFTGLIIIEFSYVVGGLVYFIIYIKQKVNKEKEHYFKDGIKYLYNKSTKIKNKFKYYLLLLSMSLLMGGNEFIIAFNVGKNLFDLRICFLFFIPLFSMFILKESIYKHHKLSLIIATFGIILLLVPVFLEINKYELIPNILNLVVGICFPLFFVVIKYGSHNYYRHPLKLSLIFGNIAIFLTSLIFVCYSLIKYGDLSYFQNLKDFIDFSAAGNIEIVYFILMFTTGTIMQVFTLLALFYFSPTLIMVNDIIHPMLLDVVIAIRDGRPSMPNFILYFAGYLIVFFSALIYNEIIIFNVCGLSNNTRKFVFQRADKEIQQIEESFNTDSSLNLEDDSSKNKEEA